MAALPIRYQELFQLPNLGINPNAITFSTVSMESDKYICVREQESGTMTIIDVAQPQSPIRRPIQAESAMVAPNSLIIALKANQMIQVFNLETKSKLKAYQMADAIVFWRFIDNTTIGIVTGTAVYHWSIEGSSDPVKVFDRHANLASAQIINYRVDPSGKWCLLVGIYPQDGRVVGTMQLYSIEKKVSQPIEGHAGAFVSFKPEGAPDNVTLFTFASRNPTASRLHVIEVGGNTAEGAYKFAKKASDIYFPAEAAADFPVALQVSSKYGLIYMVTKLGYFHIYDLESSTLIYMNRITTDTIFATALHESTGGLVGINRRGQVLLIAIDETNLVPYIAQSLNNTDLAARVASRNKLPGAEGLFARQFESFFAAGDYKEAARIAYEAPNNALRTPAIIQRFQSAPAQPGQHPPLLQYFSTLLEKGKLNKGESVELAKMVVQQRKPLLEKWLKEDKLEPSEELGDLIKPHDTNLALSVYLRGNTPQKVVQCFAETGAYDKIVLYAQKVGYKPDYAAILQSVVRTNPQAALSFALSLAQSPNGALMDHSAVVDTFMSFKLLQETTSYLLDVLKANRPEEGFLQTRLLEINLVAAPQVADAILGNQMFSHYDRTKIGQMCERAGLTQRALEHFSDIRDVKRVIVQTHNLNPEFLVNFFGTLSVENSLECLKELLQVNMRMNLQVVVQIATKYTEQLTPEAVIRLFEAFNCFEGLYYYLGTIVNTSQDPEVHFRYIQAAAKVGQTKEVERICRESSSYDPKRVKDFLKQARLPDPLPLIIVCDRFDMVDDMTAYLYANNMTKYIEVFVQRINPLRTPVVVGALLDSDAGEDLVRNLTMSVRNLCPVEPLVAEVEKRNRLKILLPWLEARSAEGNMEPATHNALAKIYVDSGTNVENFLQTNQYYDSLIVGAYCEKRDPHLAFLAYKRGRCDAELIDVTNRHGLFKNQARYLVSRQDLDLWGAVLNEENSFRRQVIDQVVQTALPESKSADEVSVAVKAFMTAELPNELIELLEKIVFENSNFSDNATLQNLLIITATRADAARVMDYINRLDKYDAEDIASICIESGLFEEAFTIFKKFKQNLKAVGVLITYVQNLERALEFVSRLEDPECWSALARAQLDNNLVTEAINSFMKANDATEFRAVIVSAEREGKFVDLVKYLQMARKKLKDGHIETELIYSFAKTNELSDLEEFISGPNIAEIQGVGDRCFDEGLYEAAKLLYTNISNHGRLASALVKLHQYAAAVEAARKANSVRTWKEVNKACVDAKEFRLAHACGVHIIVRPDELEETINYYEERGHFEEITSLLEAGVPLEGAHAGIFTELAILYTKYKPVKLMDHLKAYWARLHIPKVARACESGHHWAELCFLYVHHDEFDNATLCMIEHASDSWEHIQFKEVVAKVSNIDIYYRAITFYLNENPTLINDLLKVLAARVDHTRVVTMIRRAGHLPLIKPYLVSVQPSNVTAVNEALNEILIFEEDFEGLRSSVDTFDNFDHFNLAQQIENHELLEFRRVAAYLYKKYKRYAQSVTLSKKDKLYKDAMETAAFSGDKAIAEELLKYFVEAGNKECFAATLFTCYDLIGADVALEYAWRYKMIDFIMPYLIQTVKEYTNKIDTVVKEREKEKEAKEKEAKRAQEEMATVDPTLMYANAPLAIEYNPNPMASMGGYGAPAFGGAAPTASFGGYGAPAPDAQFGAGGFNSFGGYGNY
eukprot:TRINITY_DN948_c0_g2_i1.p1 TRINITY_DN948_c0_g2~~TRINITY_DN948_c0_g2_i1.p1  ORF type:complete len:1703 (-),score=450.85 TRINITY_DN948_c0_g2_i1:468-5576(-)